MKSLATTATILLLVVLCGTTAAWPQATDGNIIGTITDSTGSVLPNAAVELANVATGITFKTTTDSAGAYRFNNVPVGEYSVTANATGFAPAQLQRVEVRLNLTTTANLTLQVGQVTTTVEVTEAASVIDTTTAQVQSTYTTKQVIDLPLSTLDLGPLNVSLFSAGVASSGGTGLGEGPSVGGQRPRNNSFNVEGVDNNRKDVTGSNLRVSNEATREVTVLLNQYSAEFGHAGGGVFNTIIKGGTNEFHGTAYEYFYNRKLNAVDETNKRQGTRENPRYDENRFGGNVGGPIVRNKLFFFGNFEYNPTGEASAPASAKYAPTAEGYQRLASISGLSRTNLDMLREYLSPAPTASSSTTVRGVTIPTGILPINYPVWENYRNWVVSIDYSISDRDQLRGRYLDNNTKGFSAETTPDLPIFNKERTTTAKLFTITEVHTFSPSLTNELRLGYNRYNDTIPIPDFQFPGLDMFPNITLQDDLGVNIGPYNTAPQSGIINTYQIVNNLNWIKGRHALKFGGEGRKYIAPTNFIQRIRGDYIYSNLERYLLDESPDVLAQRNLGGVPFAGNSINFYGFVQDNWRITPNFTLNLGLRYEYKGVARDEELQALNASSSAPGVIEFREPKAQKYNFAPRVGFAWSPGDTATTSIRGGFSMAYDNYPDNFGTLSKPPQLESTIDRDIQETTQRFLAQGGISPAERPAQLTAAEAVAATSAWTQDQRLPYSLSWSIGIQRVFAADWTVEARYLGTRGIRLFTQHRVNVGPAPVNASRSLPTFFERPSQAQLDQLGTTLAGLRALPYYLPEFAAAGFNQQPIFTVDPRGNSVYHGLQLEATKRYSGNWLSKFAYTWSRNIDDSTADLFSTILTPRRPQDFQCMQCERSRSFLDRTHRFSATLVYDARWFSNGNWFLKNIVGNWTMGPVYIYESPQYVTPQSGGDSNLNRDNAGDRVLVNPNGQFNIGSSVTPVCRTGVGPCDTSTAGGARVVGYLVNNPNARFIEAGLGVHPNGGRNLLPTRPINNWDLLLKKRFNFTEQVAFEIGAVASNLFNHAQYTPGKINTVASEDTGAIDRRYVIPGSPLFNDPTRVFSSNPRIIQILGRFTF